MSKSNDGDGCFGAVGLFGVIAACLSYAKWGSWLWAFIHMCLGPLYLIYYFFKYVM